MPPRVHLLINQTSGTGHDAELVARIRRLLESRLGEVSASVVSGHPPAAEEARRVLGESGPVTFFVGGGGGTLRAVIEGIASASNGGLPKAERLRIATLRMGSGNLLAKELGVPKDPLEACERLAAGLEGGRFSPCCIGRYDFERESGEVETRYAASLAGFGLLGRVPGDLERWHRRFPGMVRALRALFGIERWNDVEYGVATFLRAARAAVAPGSVEAIEASANGDPVRMRLLAGVVMNFPIKNLPFEPETRMDEEKLTFYLLPLRSRFQAATLVLAPRRHARAALRLDVGPGGSVSVRLGDRERVEMFLDEDPIELYRKLTVSVLGSLSFVSAR